MSDCRFLVAFNDQQEERNNMSIGISSDAKKWKAVATLEQDKDDQEEYSYPYLIHTGGGEYHLLYTWKRERIAHIQFNEAWLKQQKGTGK